MPKRKKVKKTKKVKKPKNKNLLKKSTKSSEKKINNVGTDEKPEIKK